MPLPHIELAQFVLFAFLPVRIFVFPNTVGPVLYFFSADITSPFLATALVRRVFRSRDELVAMRAFLARGSIAEHEEANEKE